MKKNFRMIDAILAVICVIFVAEAAAPVASIGNSQYFWWIFMILFFLIPYGLISAELGTTYESDGGLYDWIKKAYGRKMATRVSWYYWINFPLWMASLAVLVPELLNYIFGVNLPLWAIIVIELIFIWLCVYISFYPVADSSWILNGSAILKVILALLVGVLGVVVALNYGVANPITATNILPSFDLDSLSYISVIIFNCLGFEVVCTFAKDMKDPKKQIPKAIIIGGLVIAGIYVFTAFGIGVAIPTSEISSSAGLIDSIEVLLQALQVSNLMWITKLVALMFLLTLFGNMISWSLGVNSVACLAAKNNDLPKVFAHEAKSNNMPIGAATMNGIVASIIVIIAPFIPNQEIFWTFFALNLVMFLMSYIPMFPAFLKLRKIDQTPRVFKVLGNDLVLKLIAYIPLILLVISIVFTAVPLSFDHETLIGVLPITVGALIFMGIGEILVIQCGKKSLN